MVRLLEHFHEGNLTCRVDGIEEKTPKPLKRMSQQVMIRARYWNTVLAPDVEKQVLFAPLLCFTMRHRNVLTVSYMKTLH
jgi:hypothetical protein